MKKINVEKSTIYRFDNRKDLIACVELLGVNGYFSDDKDFSEYEYGTLSEVLFKSEVYKYPFRVSYGKEQKLKDMYQYFIAEDSVVFEEEGDYRPYDYMCELPFKVGDVITIKAKDSDEIVEALVNEITYEECHINHISIGSRDWCDTQFLFDSFEILINDEWEPLGVLNEENRC